MAISETIKDLMEGIASLRQQTSDLGNRYMEGDNNRNIMRDGSNLRNMVKNMEFEVTKLEGKSRKDNPSVYDVEVEKYTSDEAGDLKNRLSELVDATSDFENAGGMQLGGLSNQMVGSPSIPEEGEKTRFQQDVDMLQDLSDPMLRLIQRQRAGFYPQLGFGNDPYAISIARALGQPMPELDPSTDPTYNPPVTQPELEGDDRFDPAEFRDSINSDLREGIASLERQIQDIKPPTIDIQDIINQVQSGINIPQVPSVDIDSIIRDVQSRIDIPDAFDPTSIERGLASLESQFRNLPTVDINPLSNRLSGIEQQIKNLLSSTPAPAVPRYTNLSR